MGDLQIFIYSKASITAVFGARKSPRCSKSRTMRLILCYRVSNCQKNRVLRGYCSVVNVPRIVSRCDLIKRSGETDGLVISFPLIYSSTRHQPIDIVRRVLTKDFTYLFLKMFLKLNTLWTYATLCLLLWRHLANLSGSTNIVLNTYVNRYMFQKTNFM